MVISSIIWAAVLGGVPLAMAVYARPYADKFADKTTYSNDHFYIALGRAFKHAPRLLGGAGIINVGIVVVSLVFPSMAAVQTAAFFVSPALLVASIFLFLRVLTADPSADQSAVQTAVVIGAVVLAVGTLGGALAANIQAQHSAPFTYDTVTLLKTEYRPGDQLVIEFSGTADNSGRDFIVGGYLTNTETGQRFFYDDIFIPGGEAAAPTYYPSIIYNDRLIPDVPPGEYTYTHSNRSADGSRSDSFVTDPFLVLEGE